MQHLKFKEVSAAEEEDAQEISKITRPDHFAGAAGLRDIATCPIVHVQTAQCIVTNPFNRHHPPRCEARQFPVCDGRAVQHSGRDAD